MYKIIAVLVTLTLVITSFSQEEMSKSEKKAIKKELKGYIKDPASYVAKIDNYKDEISHLGDEINTKNDAITEKNVALTDANNTIDDLRAQLLKVEDQPNCGEMPEGSTYRVQIGLYEFFSIAADLQADVKTVLLEEVNGQSRYSIGNFSTVEEASRFQKDVKKMGIKDAFVSEYIGGQRNMDFDARNVIGTIK